MSSVSSSRELKVFSGGSGLPVDNQEDKDDRLLKRTNDLIARKNLKEAVELADQSPSESIRIATRQKVDEVLKKLSRTDCEKAKLLAREIKVACAPLNQKKKTEAPKTGQCIIS